jgi:hypothetical protein
VDDDRDGIRRRGDLEDRVELGVLRAARPVPPLGLKTGGDAATGTLTSTVFRPGGTGQNPSDACSGSHIGGDTNRAA